MNENNRNLEELKTMLSEEEQYLIYRNVLKNRVQSDIKRIATENSISVSTEDIEAITEKYVLHHEYNSDTNYTNDLQTLIKEQMDAKETFTVFAKINARWSVNIKANTIKEVMQKIEKRFYAADFGDAYDIDYQVVNIETPDGKTINPQH
jgi:16S rRNA C967 or C1407 C5-methylase (RsmB/RsmF family)